MPELLYTATLPLIYGLGFALSLCWQGSLWRLARLTTLVALLAVIGLVGLGVLRALADLPVDRPGLVVALLVALLGWVITGYASRYLAGEPGQHRFVRALLFTLACVGLLVLSRHLVIMVLAWTGSSLGLHQLLTFYRERKAAQVVAHKHALVSRLAEICLVAALVLIYQTTGELHIDQLNGWLQAQEALPASLHWAAVLLVMAVILKTAQLPLHGWLIQVMEAPTPVSALLHAGVVNMGGFVLIRLAELLSLAPAAQALLVVVGSLTAVLAGLVMLTRISIKVRLAWSTCAQMGFMLMEAGLGLYELVLLHLVAHSVYKAHAFLNAGDTVSQARHNDLLAGADNSHSVPRYLLALPASALLVFASAGLWLWLLPTLSLPVVALVIVALGLAPLLWSSGGMGGLLLGALRVALISQLYLFWHSLFAGLVPADSNVPLLLLVWVITSFSVLYLAQLWLRCHPRGRFATTFFPWAYCGFYLDESFTRLTMKIWPPRLDRVQSQTLVNRHQPELGDSV